MLGHFSFFDRTTRPFFASVYTQAYSGIILYLFLAALLCVVLSLIAYTFSLSSEQDVEKRSEYECGFEPFDSATRLPFDVHFYLVGILFLIFDVEIALLFPWALSLRTTGWFGFYIMIGFIFVLTVGFLYEWKRGALIWPSRQAEQLFNSGLTKYGAAFCVLAGYHNADNDYADTSFVYCIGLSIALQLGAFFINAATNNTKKDLRSVGLQPDAAVATPRLESTLLRFFKATARRLAKLAERVKRTRATNLDAYIKNVALGEKQLNLHRRTLAFYVRKISNFITRERSKNFQNEPKILKFENRVLAIAERAREEYIKTFDAYAALYQRLTEKRRGLRSNKRQKLLVQRTAVALLKASKFRLTAHLKTAKSRVKRYHRKPSRQLNFPKSKTPHRALRALVPAVVFAPSNSYFLQFVGDFLPELGLTAILTLVLGLMACELGQTRSYRVLAAESMRSLRCGLTIVAVLYVIQLACGGAVSLFNGYVIVTTYTTALKLLTVLSGRFILSNSEKYMREHSRHLLEYPLVLTLAILFMLLLVSSGHLISAFLALVGFSLNLYVLILFDATAATAREAGIKYFYLSTISSGLILYGIFLIFIVTGTAHLYEIGHFLSTEPGLVENAASILQLALVLLLVGLFFKLSAFPGHLWAAEVYEGSPDTITAFFMLPVKVAVLAFVTQLLAVAFEPLTALWQPIIILSAAASLIWGCLAALTEPKTKRFLAYASINQIGFLLVGLAAGSVEGYRTAIFYLLLYAIMNVGLLTVFLNARRNDGRGLLYLTDFRGFGQRYAQYSWSVAMVLFSMAGIPPLAGFFGKYYLLLHAQEQALYGLVIIGLATSLISTYYYLRLIKIFWFEGAAGMTPIVCDISRQKAVTLQSAEWALWLFIVQAGPVIYSLETAIDSMLVLNNFYLN